MTHPIRGGYSKIWHPLPILALALALHGASLGAQEPTPVPDGASPPAQPQPPALKQMPRVVMAKVGPEEITVDEMMNYVSRHGELVPKLLNNMGKTELLQDMIKERLFKLAMLKEGLLGEPEDGKKGYSQKEIGAAFTALRLKHFPPPPYPSDEEAKAYYEAHQDMFGIPQMIRIGQIQVQFPTDASEEQRGKARARAEEALKRIKAGESFEAVAREITDNPRGKDTDGDLGFLPMQTESDWFNRNVAAIPVGEMSGVLESPTGYEIYRVTERKAGQPAPYEAVAAQVKTYMRQQIQMANMAAFLRQAAQEFGVTVVMKELEAAANF